MLIGEAPKSITCVVNINFNILKQIMLWTKFSDQSDCIKYCKMLSFMLNISYIAE